MGRKAEIEKALQVMLPPSPQIRSKRALRRHIIETAGQHGFSIFRNTRFGYEDFTVKTRVKFYRKYGTTPVTKILVIPSCMVRRLWSIYRVWPVLGQFLLITLLWHEYRHLMQDPTKFESLRKMEEEANRFMMDKMGRAGLIACVWYFCSYEKAHISELIFNAKKRLVQGAAGKQIIGFLKRTYPDLIPPDEYNEIIDEVLWLEEEYMKVSNARTKDRKFSQVQLEDPGR